MTNERRNEAPRFIVLGVDAEPNVGPGFWGAFSYYLNPSRWGKTAGRATAKELWGVFVGKLLFVLLISLTTFGGILATDGENETPLFLGVFNV
ncbi:MAG: hypothetical protein IJX36_06560 [Thermoguttaceae bacterium]|nr:hypothetical protein [Thermoguttaceae bacterium]MBQ8363569.1 hypothetical protein [Thermoguttaceae bacterium]MBQ9128307.1 hypothetical protein [Thermoguttaceae bacterium]